MALLQLLGQGAPPEALWGQASVSWSVRASADPSGFRDVEA
jgi:hypothetical protein